MFSDKLKSLFTRSVSGGDQESFFERAASIISSARRITPQNPIAEFQPYLQSLPTDELKLLKNVKPKPSRTASLRPQLVVKCYKNIPPIYFEEGYEIKEQIFTQNRKETSEKTARMHEYLDEVEICLFNQISSQFDEILSVLRTIESLECLVNYNSNRLSEVRKTNITVAKAASSRHLKIVSLLKRQERLKGVISKLAEIKIYTSFVGGDLVDLKMNRSRSHTQRHQKVNQIRMRRELYFQLQATKNFEERVEEIETNLKRSYSDTINDAFFKYAVQIFPYDSNFWEKKFMGRTIFEEEHQEPDGTVILDQSMLMEEEVDGVHIKTIEEREEEIIINVVSGWRDGEYSTGSIKAAFDKFVKERHLRFLSDCRNFCFQAYLRGDRKKIENPNIANVMQQMNVFFCTKTFLYYADSYRTMLTRCFSLVSGVVGGMLKTSVQQLTIDQKQKIAGVVDGLFSILWFVLKGVYQRVLQTVELKHVHDSMELQDFKQLVNVLETEQDFIVKHIKRYMNFNTSGTFLDAVVSGCLSKMDFDMVQRSKQQKVLSFLNRTHRYIIENQLRDSFENEIWKPTDIPTFYYDSLHYLITGESLNLRRNKNHTIRHNMSNNFDSSVFIDRLGQEASLLGDTKIMGNFRIIRSQIFIDKKIYKVNETLLLLLEIIEDYTHLAQFYPFAKEEVGIKIFELLRAYNTSSHQLIILGGAVKLQKIKTKNITAKHLALNSLCLSFLLYIVSCIRQRVPIHEQQKIRKDLESHEESIIKKLSIILSSKISQALPDVNLDSVPSKGTEAIVNSTKILHDILVDFYQKDVLTQIFVKANVDTYLNKIRTMEVTSKVQAQSLKEDMNFYFQELKFLQELIGEYQALRLEGEDILRIKFEQL